jgi:hypothetical protein
MMGGLIVSRSKPTRTEITVRPPRLEFAGALYLVTFCIFD